jgi:tungstate transport system ATP-binding protein
MSASILPGRLDRIEYAVAGERLIHGLTLDLEAGPRTIVLGANGAGKSLTLRLVHGLLRPTGGRITWQRPDAQRRQAMVFQRPVLLRRSAGANVDFALRLRGFSRRERIERRDAALARAGLAAANLDPAATKAVEDLVGAIHGAGTKIVMTTHDLAQARRLADEVIFLHRGHLVERAPAERFFAAPQTPEARAFLSGELLW